MNGKFIWIVLTCELPGMVAVQSINTIYQRQLLNNVLLRTNRVSSGTTVLKETRTLLRIRAGKCACIKPAGLIKLICSRCGLV